MFDSSDAERGFRKLLLSHFVNYLELLSYRWRWLEAVPVEGSPRHARAAVVRKALVERAADECSRARVVASVAFQESAQEIVDPLNLWGAVLGIFKPSQSQRLKDVEEEYGPYAHEMLAGGPRSYGDMYHSHICDRLAVEGSNFGEH
eukprot:gene10576-12235_t